MISSECSSLVQTRELGVVEAQPAQHPDGVLSDARTRPADDEPSAAERHHRRRQERARADRLARRGAGRPPPRTADGRMGPGYWGVSSPGTRTVVFARVVQGPLDEIKATGTSTGMRDRMMAFDDVNELLGLSRWQS